MFYFKFWIVVLGGIVGGYCRNIRIYLLRMNILFAAVHTVPAVMDWRTYRAKIYL